MVSRMLKHSFASDIIPTFREHCSTAGCIPKKCDARDYLVPTTTSIHTGSETLLDSGVIQGWYDARNTLQKFIFLIPTAFGTYISNIVT